MSLKGRSFVTLKDFSKEELVFLMELSAELKIKKNKGIRHDTLKSRKIALIFEEPDIELRSMYQEAAKDLGIDFADEELDAEAGVEDAAFCLGEKYNGIVYCGTKVMIAERLAKSAGVPVWNAHTTGVNPAKALSDILTIKDKLGKVEDKKLVYLGNAKVGMGSSLMVACSKMGMNFAACGPADYFPSAALAGCCEDYAYESDGSVVMTEVVAAALRGADIIYSDIWFTGTETDEERESAMTALAPYDITEDMIALAGGDVSIMYHYDDEYSLHIIKAVMAATLGAV